MENSIIVNYLLCISSGIYSCIFTFPASDCVNMHGLAIMRLDRCSKSKLDEKQNFVIFCFLENQ